MRIGINGRFYAARLTGVQRFARELTTRLSRRADTVLLLPSDAAAPDQSAAPVMRGRLSGHGWEQLELGSLARASRCDVVLHPANTAPLSGGPHVVVVHDVLPLSNPEWFSRGYATWHRHVVRAAIRRAAIVLAPSQWSANEIARFCAVPAARIRVVTQGLAPFDRAADAHFVHTVRRGFNLPAAYLLMVGYADPRKNIEFMLSVVDALRQSLPELGIALVGRTESRAHGRRSIELPAWAHVIEDINDHELRALYTGALALCFPSLGEGFGRPPLEALACGTPALAANYGAAAEVLGEAGQILPLDADAWVSALRRIAAAPEARARAAEDGAALSRRYDWDRSVEQVLNACSEAGRAGARRKVLA